MMDKSNRILEMIKAFLDSDQEDATEFSIELENELCESYDIMTLENAAVTEILNEELPDICADYELGMDMGQFKERIRKEYEKAVKAI